MDRSGPIQPKSAVCARAATPATPHRKRRWFGSRRVERPESRVGPVSTGEHTHPSKCPDCNARDARCRVYDVVRLLGMTRTYSTLQDVPLDRTNTARCRPTWRPGLVDEIELTT